MCVGGGGGGPVIVRGGYSRGEGLESIFHTSTMVITPASLSHMEVFVCKYGVQEC